MQQRQPGFAEHETLAKLPNVEFPFQALSGCLEPSRPVKRGGVVGKWVGRDLSHSHSLWVSLIGVCSALDLQHGFPLASGRYKS